MSLDPIILEKRAIEFAKLGNFGGEALEVNRQLTDADLAGAGLSPGTVRVSIGLEDAEDLVADLLAAADPS